MNVQPAAALYVVRSFKSGGTAQPPPCGKETLLSLVSGPNLDYAGARIPE